MAFKNVVDFVELPHEHVTFSDAFREIKSMLEERLYQRNPPTYMQIETGWWIIDDQGNPIKWQKACQQAAKENLI